MIKFTTAAQAQQAFYLAFTEGSVEHMSAVWSSEREVVCVHPGSDVLHGVVAIMQSWSRILSPTMSVTIEVEPVSVFETEDIAVHVVYEHLSAGPAEQIATVIATNVFRLTDAGWQMVEHHGTQPVARSSAMEHVAPSKRVLQ